MSLVKCKECGKEISTTAATCPHCGAKNQQPNGCLVVSILLGFLAIAIPVVMNVSDRGDQKTPRAQPKPKDDTDQLAIDACQAAQKAVEKQLKSPSSADFPNCVLSAHKYKINTNPQKTVFIVFGEVEAKNSFGAQIRSKFAVEMNRKNGKFETVEVAIE